MSQSLFAQTLTQTIRGTVVDKDAKTPLTGAQIRLNTDPIMGAYTDENGKFRIEEVPVGNHSLAVSYLGYEELSLNRILLGSGKELVLNLELVESVMSTETVVISGSKDKHKPLNQMANVSARSFTVEETQRYAASFSDPARMASSFAGVTGGDDVFNEIVVRGNSPRGLLWRLEGLEIPNPNHFSDEGASSGGVSVLTSNVLANSDFFTGAFPSEYGNALSGVFDINLRKGNNEKQEYTLQAGFLGLEAAAEGPFKAGYDGSYLVNYRYSTLAVLRQLGLIDLGDDKDVYQDLAFKLHFPTQKAGTFTLYGIGGLSESEYDPIDAYGIFNSDMGVTGLKHRYLINNRMYLKTNIALSGSRIRDDFTEELDSVDTYTFKEKFTKSYVRTSISLHNKINARNYVEGGLIYSHLGYNFTEREIDPKAAPPFDDFIRFNDKGTSGYWQAYVNWKYRIGENLSLVNGLHYLRFDLNGKQSIEPRSSLKWQFHPKQSLTAGFGVHSRLESLEYYLGNFIDSDGSSTQHNRDLGFSKARHYVLGYDNLIRPDLYLKVETYYQQLYNIPVSADINSLFASLLLTEGFTADPLVNEGTGTNYGLEVTLEKYFSRNYYFLLTGSLYESTYKARDGVSRNSPYNGNYGTNVLAGREFKIGKKGKNNLLGVSLKGTWNGNRRFVPIDLEQSKTAGHSVRDKSQAFEERYPDYTRVDLQVWFRRNRRKHTGEWRLDIQNVINRENTLYTYYSKESGQIETETHLGILPVLSYRYQF